MNSFRTRLTARVSRTHRALSLSFLVALLAVSTTSQTLAGIGGSQPEFPLSADCWIEPDWNDCNWVGPQVEFQPPGGQGGVVVLDGFRSTRTLPGHRFHVLVQIGEEYRDKVRIETARLARTRSGDVLPEFELESIERSDGPDGEGRGLWRDLGFEALTVHPGDTQIGVLIFLVFASDLGPEDREPLLRSLRFAYANQTPGDKIDDFTSAPTATDAPDFTFEFGRPFANQHVGPAGGASTGTYRVAATTANNTTTDGIQGWSVSVRSVNAEVSNVTVADTAGDLVANGGYQVGGFEFSEIINGGGGALSAVVLSIAGGSVLPANGIETITRFDVTVVHPDAGSCSNVQMIFLDGQQGSGDPVDNLVVFQDASVNPTLINDSFQVCGATSNWVTYDANGDANMNMADGVAHLASLFTGGPSPICEEAMDFNGDNQLNIADPVGLFSYLFLGGPPPIDGLGCGEYPTCPTNCQ
ncbi:MAG: hypothetical protein AAF488_14145 [Planctomycetota bacterium]